MDFTNINFVAIAVGTIAAFLFGFLWYAPPVFGRTWQRHTGISDAQMKDGKVLLRMGPALVLTFIMGVMLDVILPSELMKWDEGAVNGLLIGLGLTAPALALQYIFARKSVHLFLIDAGYTVFALMILGAVLVLMS